MVTSRFLTLPPTLRHKIYASLFSPLRLTHPNLKTPTHPLLSTSPLICLEALPYLWRHATFDVGTTEGFVGFLSGLETEKVKELRKMVVRGVPFPVYGMRGEEERGYFTHFFTTVLSLFPSLQLDHLTLHDAYHGPDVAEDGWGHNATYEEIGLLVKQSKGFRNVTCCIANDSFMKPVVFKSIVRDMPPTEERHEREPQPRTWDAWVKQRDGEESGAGVEMFACKGGVWEEVKGDYVPEEAGGDGGGEEEVAIEVRIRRGRGADVVQDGVFKDEYSANLGKLFEELSWEEIKERGLFVEGAEVDPTAHL